MFNRTDKVPVWWHSYTPSYHELFKDRREQINKVLEIGIGSPATMPHVEGYKTGASLRMWRDYFINASVHGLDIAPETMICEERITTSICNQKDISSLQASKEFLGSGYDVIIDDGSHVPDDQLRSVSVFYELLNPGGLYLIEDIRDLKTVLSGLKDYKTETRVFGQIEEEDIIIIIRGRK